MLSLRCWHWRCRIETRLEACYCWWNKRTTDHCTECNECVSLLSLIHRVAITCSCLSIPPIVILKSLLPWRDFLNCYVSHEISQLEGTQSSGLCFLLQIGVSMELRCGIATCVGADLLLLPYFRSIWDATAIYWSHYTADGIT